MLITPDSSVSLYADVPISDGHEIVFRSKTEQSTYFATKRIASKAGCTYMRKTGRLRIEWSTETVMRADFISFKNPSFENITFYAKLIDYEYVNNVTTDCIYEIDWFQSFCFDVVYHACSILREHLTESDYQKAVENPWRRDIPELLTDEGLPCDESLECIYTDGSLAGGAITGNRFKVPSGTTSILGDAYANDLYAVFLLSQFDLGEWSSEDGTAFVDCFNYFGSVNQESTWGDFINMFTSINQRCIRGTAMLGVRMDEADFKEHFTKAIDLLTSYSVTGSIVGIYVLPKWSLKGYFKTSIYEATDNTEGFEEQMINIPKLVDMNKHTSIQIYACKNTK